MIRMLKSLFYKVQSPISMLIEPFSLYIFVHGIDLTGNKNIYIFLFSQNDYFRGPDLRHFDQETMKISKGKRELYCVTNVNVGFG